MGDQKRTLHLTAQQIDLYRGAINLAIAERRLSQDTGQRWADEIPAGGEKCPECELSPGRLRDELKPAVAEVFKHYLVATGRNGRVYLMTQRRLYLGTARLKEALRMTSGELGLAVALMKAAVNELARSDFHMGRSSQNFGKRYCDWENHLFRNAEQFQGWLADAEIAEEDLTHA